MPRINGMVPFTQEKNSRTVRWLPLGAIGLLAALLVAAIVLATTSGGDEPQTAQASATPASQAVQGYQFLPRAAASDQQCAAHAFGDVQASLQQTACTTMRRGSYETSVNGRPVAVSIAVVYFNDESAAGAFKKAADTAGGGGVTDLATETIEVNEALGPVLRRYSDEID